jgi:glycine cleavage system H protein
MRDEEIRFTETHEWVTVDDGIATVGISDYAQSELGEIVFVDSPKPETHVAAGDTLATIESVKSVNDIYAPVTGTIVEINETLDDSPGLMNSDAQGEGWIARIEMDSEEEVEELMTSDEYDDFVTEESDD